jgi:hypothetical protein
MKKLQVDDFEIGMTVTVFKGAIKHNSSTGLSSLLTGTTTEENNYGKGSILEVEAIDLPYIITCNLLHPSLDSNTWDLRNTKFAIPSDSFIKTTMEGIRNK